MYENVNGLNSRISDNEKLDKAKDLIDEIEADVVCYSEHRLNLVHKDNKNGFAQMFRGGEAEVRAVAGHNKHEAKTAGRVQEGGTAMMLFGQLVEQYDFESSGRDESGLGRWVVMVFRGENDITTRILCGYNPCYNKKKESKTSYQQQRRYFITKEKDLTCPRKRFHDDLIKQLETWRRDGDRLIVCLDANEDIYKKSLGKSLCKESGLGMKEVVGEFTGSKLGATYFRGSKPIDGVWATPDIDVVGACVMPVGYGIGDHRVFLVDFRLESMIGAAPPKIVRSQARRLNTKIPGVAERYNETLERNVIRHRLNSRMIAAEMSRKSNAALKLELDKIDEECTRYMRCSEKRCRRIKSGRIPFSPEAAIWIRRRQAYASLLRRKDGKIRNWSNLRRTAQRCGIKKPLSLTRAQIKEGLKLSEEKCAYFQRHGHRYRKKHLQKRLQVAKMKHNKTAEQQILDIIQREKERSFWRRLNYAMKKHKGRSVRLVQAELPDGSVREAVSQQDVETTIWNEIHDKRFYLAEQAPICKGKLRGDFGYMANTPEANAALEGRYNFPDGCDSGTRDLIEEAARIRERVPKNTVSLDVTSDVWSNRWASAKEKTSSSESGRHFGHYIAGAKSKLVSSHHALKSAICLRRGLSLDRWARGLSCMLEKTPGCRLLSKLRSILLMEADYNSNNKLIYGVRMLDNVRKFGLMEEEIYSELGKTADDGALAKVLFYDIARQSRLCAAISSVDASNCYDRIAHAIASLIFQACGVPVEGVEAMLSAIQNMKYFLRTAFGDSRNCRGSKIEIKYQGLCQGNGAAPAGWAVISITILRAHKRKGHAATFVCPISNVKATLAAILFVDDCDLIHIDMDGNDDAFVTFQKMQASVTNWGRLLLASGGAYKPTKCFFHLISFVWDRKGDWSYADNHLNEEFEMKVPMPNGESATIDHLPVNTPQKTLGVWTAPDGSCEGGLKAMREKAQDWLDRAKEGNLRRKDVWFLLDCQFWKGVGYGLGTCSAELKLLEKCLQKQYFQLLPLGGVIRTAPAVSRQLDSGFYGIGCPHVGVECFVEQVDKVLTHFGCDSNVGMKMEMSYNKLLIELGLSTQPLSHDYSRYKNWVTRGWMVSLWEKCWAFGVTPKFQVKTVEFGRERDKFLMPLLVELGFTEDELRRLNKVRLYQQVLFLSDVLGVSGRKLDRRYLRKRRPTEKWSDFHFPTEKPPNSDFALWRRALHQLVPDAGLGVGLGRLHTVGNKRWEWRLREDEEELYQVSHRSTLVYTKHAPGSRRWEKLEEREEVPSGGIPCTVREQGNGDVQLVNKAANLLVGYVPANFMEVLHEWGCEWMWKTLRVLGDLSWLEESIRAGTCVAVTDGSYIKEHFTDLCSCAFVLECSEGRGRILGEFPEQSLGACAYRGELLGLMAMHLILLAVNKACERLTGLVKIYSDCLGALQRVTHLPKSRLPSGVKHADILKNIMVHCTKLSFGCEYFHVEAHQDERKSFQQLSRPAQLNCYMDSNAKQVIWGCESGKLPRQEMFPLEPVGFFVGQEKVVASSADSLRFWCHKKLAREVLSDKKVKVLDYQQYDEVHWRAVHGGLKSMPRLFQLWASKQVLSIAGTNEMQARYTPNHSNKCPSCTIAVETCSHVLRCDEEGRVEVLHQLIECVDTWLEDNNTDPKLRRYLVDYAHGRGGELMKHIVHERSGPYREMAESVDIIGWRRFMEGMISVKIVAVQQRASVGDKPGLTLEKWAQGLVSKLLEVTHGLWLYRNVQVHDAVCGEIISRRKEEIRKEIEDQMELGGVGLQEEDMYLLDINLDSLETSSGEDQAYWLLALKAAREATLLRERAGRGRRSDQG